MSLTTSVWKQAPIVLKIRLLLRLFSEVQLLLAQVGIITLRCFGEKIHSTPWFQAFPLLFFFTILNVALYECASFFVYIEKRLWWLFLLEQYQAEVWDDFRFSLLLYALYTGSACIWLPNLIVLSTECNRERRRVESVIRGRVLLWDVATHIRGDDSPGTSCRFQELIEKAAPPNLQAPLS